jgi:hypothetical protein
VQNLQQVVVILRAEVNFDPSTVNQDGVGTDLLGFFACEVVRVSDYFALSHAVIVGPAPAPYSTDGRPAEVRYRGSLFVKLTNLAQEAGLTPREPLWRAFESRILTTSGSLSATSTQLSDFV